MSGKIDLADQVKSLQKHMGGVAKLVKDLLTKVEGLEKKVENKERNELKEIMESRRVIEEVIVANSVAIKKIETEIIEITKKNNCENVKKEDLESFTGVKKVKSVMVKEGKKKCRYFNRGYCRYKSKCRYVHPERICTEHDRNKKCDIKECADRHPKTCKWLTSKVGCKQEGCVYLHDTLENARHVYKCASCKDVWEDKMCVMEYTIHNQRVHFCLNCDDWVKQKENVFDEGWTLLDQDGFLRTEI